MYLDADLGEITGDLERFALEKPEVGELHRHARMDRDLAWQDPAHLAAGLCDRVPRESVAAEHVQRDVEAARRQAAHLVPRDEPKVAHAVAGLLEKLAPRAVLKALARLEGATRQEPRARERAAGLLHHEDATGLIDARDDGSDARAIAHPRASSSASVAASARE